MKKFLLVLTLTFGALAAQANEGVLFSFKSGTAGDVIGGTVTYIYHRAEDKQMKSLNETKLLARVAKKKVCGDKDVSALIKEDKIVVQYLYVSEKAVSMVVVDSCD